MIFRLYGVLSFSIKREGPSNTLASSLIYEQKIKDDFVIWI